jgi:hypothetical protein
MKTRLVALVLVLLWSTGTALGWGQLGHRVVGEVAWKHLTPKAQKRVASVLGDESLALSSTWMDFIKSNPEKKHMDAWHYCTVCNGCSYADSMRPKEGDIIGTLERLLVELETKKFTDGDEKQALRMLVHLVGDLHQPLHVGQPGDRGGNDFKVKWFGQSTNLHTVWDTHLIDDYGLSYTELAKAVDRYGADTVRQWQATTVRDWALESRVLRETLYPAEDKTSLSYRYSYDYLDDAHLRLAQAGIRLAGLLNRIYG